MRDAVGEVCVRVDAWERLMNGKVPFGTQIDSAHLERNSIEKRFLN